MTTLEPLSISKPFDGTVSATPSAIAERQCKWSRKRLHEIALMLAINDCETSIDAWSGVEDDSAKEIIRGHQELMAALKSELDDWSAE